MSAAVDNLLSRLKRVKGTGSGWQARCPAHEDRVASLSVSEGDDGRALVKCHAGCAAETVAAALGLQLADLFEREPRPVAVSINSPSRPTEDLAGPAAGAQRSSQHRNASKGEGDSADRPRLRISDADARRFADALLGSEKALERLSALRGWTREALDRMEVGFDGRRVTFPYRDAHRRLVGLGRYQPNPERRGESEPKLKAEAGSQRQLWPAPESLETDGYLWLVEGEPDAIRAHSLGLAAVAVPGVEGWRAEYAKRFAGRRVVVCLDCDEPGGQAAERIAVELAPVAAEVRLLELDAGRNDGFDLSDFTGSATSADERDAMRRILLDKAQRALRLEPPEPQNGAGALDAVEAQLRRYAALSAAQYVVVTLWIAHAHALDATSTTAYLHVTSAEAESGKSRLLEVIEPLVPKPMYAASMTPAVLFRAVQKLKPTLLVDEVDNLLRDKEAKSELLGLLNAGYRRGALAYRIGGGNRDELQSFETFSAKAIAGLDDLVATLASRCLRIEMQRRRVDEQVEDFFREEAHAEAAPIRDDLAAWAARNIETLRSAKPDRLGVRDRLEEACRLLLAIAELCGERWRSRAREALLELAGASIGGAMSERTQLLADVRDVFADAGDPAELTTAALLDGLLALDESPWRSWWGVERDGEVHPSKGAARKLSSHLRGFKVTSHSVGERRQKGYRRSGFEDAWKRYLPALAPSPDSNPLKTLKRHEEAENEPSQSAQRAASGADSPTAQSRMVEPNERIERIYPEGTRRTALYGPASADLLDENHRCRRHPDEPRAWCLECQAAATNQGDAA
jgi:hypothetical protein